MNSITQDMKFRQSLMNYAKKYGVSRASRKYNKSRSYIYFWLKRWDGSVLSNPEDDDSVIPVITHADFERYKADGTVAGGMIPKLENALAAIDAGVKEVIITLATAIDGKHGTVIK